MLVTPSVVMLRSLYGHVKKRTKETMNSNPDQPRIGNILYPVGSIEEAVRFFGEVFSLDTRFVDGDRYAALDGRSTTLALASGAEAVVGRPAASFAVQDLEQAIKVALANGARLRSQPAQGPHETRVVLGDPWGNPIILYSRR